jgi:hypothetical protein
LYTVKQAFTLDGHSWEAGDAFEFDISLQEVNGEWRVAGIYRIDGRGRLGWTPGLANQAFFCLWATWNELTKEKPRISFFSLKSLQM